MAYSLTWLPDVLEAAGLKVAECTGWRTRGRGDVGTIRGVICHHTAGAPQGVMPSLNTLINGRAASANAKALAGPLAQLGLARDGTLFIVAAGRANHAGVGSWQSIDTGNTNFIGIEAENTGIGEPWPDVQLDAYYRAVAAILKYIGAPETMVCGHKEYALPKGRKNDPTLDMAVFRNQVGQIMRGIAQVRPAIPAMDASGRATLRRGTKGELVKQIQFTIGIYDDGIFGSNTEAAVRVFQRNHALVPDGIVGPKTWYELTRLETLSTGQQATTVSSDMGKYTPNQACIDLIKHFESCELEAYPDPGSGGEPWTIGWGSTGPDINKGTQWTQAECDARFESDLMNYGIKVAALLGNAPTSGNQFGALTSFAYNAGLHALAESTLLRKHKAGNFEGAAEEFGRWIYGSGKLLPGLVRRRTAEAQLYRTS
ncbi:glycoside hydrolase family protein [Enterobacter sichuanensis]|uniref:glycoside hydrolase family protein n=1 Tax=Enterobacter sichuanensis TaxID=2071710 RepID=UPI001C555ED5|nr:glycoside hydrolase family protein [Enterobacter sichuanensis]